MSEANILIVEDDEMIAQFVELELQQAGYAVSRAADGKVALEAVEKINPDLMVLDWMLPEIDGLEVTRRLRGNGRNIPILMLTAMAEPQNVVSGLDGGADDYLRKPFEISELLSRVQALLRRTESERIAFTNEASGVEIDPSSRQAKAHGEQLDLTAKEFDLLFYLVKNAGSVISRDEILEAVWGGQHATDSNVIEVFICHLRNKIGDRDNKVIQTIRGVGYFFAKS